MSVTNESSGNISTYGSTTLPNTATLLQGTISVLDNANDGRPDYTTIIAIVTTLDHPTIPGKYPTSVPNRVYYDSNTEGEIDLTLIDTFSMWSNEYDGFEIMYIYAKTNAPRAITKALSVTFPTDCIKKNLFWATFSGSSLLAETYLTNYHNLENTDITDTSLHTVNNTGLTIGSTLFSYWVTWKFQLGGFTTRLDAGTIVGMTNIGTFSSSPTRNGSATLDSDYAILFGVSDIVAASLDTKGELEFAGPSPCPASIFSIRIMPEGWSGPPPWVDSIGEEIEPPCGYVGSVVDALTPDLSHLPDGQVVAILADGVVLDEQAIVSSTVTIPDGHTKVYIGLPYYADFETLAVAVPMNEGTIQSRRVKISNVTFQLQDTLGGQIGPDEDSLYDAFTQQAFRQSSGQNLGDKEMFTGKIRQPLGSQYEGEGSIFVRQVDPLPITIGAVIPEVDIGKPSR